jgi:Domain of unknown function (DUF4350)
MPLNIAASDKRLLIWTGIIVTVLIVAVALLSDEEDESGVPSTYSSQSSGARAAYLLLKETGHNVERWEESPLKLPKEGENTTLVLAQPSLLPDKEEVAALKLFVSRGGRVLITGVLAQSFFPGKEIEIEALPSPEWKEYQPQLLTELTQGGAIKMSPRAYWKSKSTYYLSHYADDNRPIVVSYRIGTGKIIWWAAATPLTNAGISASGNLALFLNSIGEGNIKDTHILWDEYFHSSHRSLDDYVGEPPIKYGLLQCLLFGLALVLTYSRRNLPIHPLPQKSRLSPLEFVQTLGGLYRRAKATRAALEVPYHRFRLAATRHLGLRHDTPAEDLARSLRNRLGYGDEDLLDLMRTIESTLANPYSREETVLKLVQQLNMHMQQLKLVQQESIAHANRVPGAATRKN